MRTASQAAIAIGAAIGAYLLGVRGVNSWFSLWTLPAALLSLAAIMMLVAERRVSRRCALLAVSLAVFVALAGASLITLQVALPGGEPVAVILGAAYVLAGYVLLRQSGVRATFVRRS